MKRALFGQYYPEIPGNAHDLPQLSCYINGPVDAMASTGFNRTVLEVGLWLPIAQARIVITWTRCDVFCDNLHHAENFN